MQRASNEYSLNNASEKGFLKLVKISPWQGIPGVLCLPKVSNIPKGKPGWVEVPCPVCGDGCWIAPEAQNLMDRGKVTGACTSCALRMGRAKPGEVN